MKFRSILGGLAFAALFVVAAQAAPPQVTQINPGDLFQDIVNGSPQVGNQYAPASLLQNYLGVGAPTRGNALIGGDATTNLWQHGTAGTGLSSATATYTGSADRWAYFSGASTEFKVIRSSATTDVPVGYGYAFKFQRTASQTGVVQSCMVQVVESVNAYQFQGQTAELDFHAYTGANFSAASAAMTAYIITGTAADEGLSSLVAGSWTGQANATAAVISLGGVSTAGRYAAIAAIPSGTAEIAVELCYKPVGTAGANDYIAFAGIQLIRNPANASFASGVVGYSSTTANLTLAAFERRTQAAETNYQYRYYYRLAEATVSNALYVVAPCAVSTTSLGVCMVPFPVPMRVAPAVTLTTGFGMTVAAQTSAVACTALAVAGGSGLSLVASPTGAPITCASSAGFGAAGTAAFLTVMASTSAGVISASAEL